MEFSKPRPCQLTVSLSLALVSKSLVLAIALDLEPSALASLVIHELALSMKLSLNGKSPLVFLDTVHLKRNSCLLYFVNCLGQEGISCCRAIISITLVHNGKFLAFSSEIKSLALALQVLALAPSLLESLLLTRHTYRHTVVVF